MANTLQVDECLHDMGENQVFNDFEGPSPANLNRNSVFKLAEKVASDLKYSEHRDIHQVVESLGGAIQSKDFWSEGSTEGGSLEVRAEDDFTIYVPVDTSEVRDRFTIAHELGHYFLHFLWPVQVMKREAFKLRASRYGSDRPEWEANWFASAFLMPSVEFTRKVKEENYTIGQLSRHFSVSAKAAEIRADVLKLDVKNS